MKTTFTLLIVSIFAALNCSAQNLDVNGRPVSIANTNLNPPYQNTSFSPYVYDSVRILSEINVVGMADAYPWISADGLRLYYLSVTLGNIAYTSRTNTSSYFDPPVIANPIFPSTTFSCWFSVDELDVYYVANSTLFYAHRNTIASAFNPPVTITINGALPSSSISLDPNQNELYFRVGIGGIARCIRTSPTSFDFTYMMQSTIGNIESGQLSKDGLEFFAGIDLGAGGISIYSFTRTTLADSLTNPQLVQGINPMANLYSLQASMSDSLTWVAFVSSNVNLWTEDELYLAHLGNTTSVFDPEKVNFKPTVFPNPVADNLYMRLNKSSGKKMIMEIYSVQNIFIEKQFIDADEPFDVSKYNNGLYLYKIINADYSAIYNGKFVVMH